MDMNRISAPPHDIAEAMATAADPARHRGNCAVIQTTWAFLKEARGQLVDFDRLDAMHDAISPFRPAAPAPADHATGSDDARDDDARHNPVDAARIRALPAIRRAIFGPRATGGAA